MFSFHVHDLQLCIIVCPYDLLLTVHWLFVSHLVLHVTLTFVPFTAKYKPTCAR